jgi:hypothetical protein
VIESSDADYAPRITAHDSVFWNAFAGTAVLSFDSCHPYRNPGESATPGSEDSRLRYAYHRGEGVIERQGSEKGNMVARESAVPNDIPRSVLGGVLTRP